MPIFEKVIPAIQETFKSFMQSFSILLMRMGFALTKRLFASVLLYHIHLAPFNLISLNSYWVIEQGGGGRGTCISNKE